MLWVLDWIGYDARGGNAQVFSSAEAAKDAAVSRYGWVLAYGIGRVEWHEDTPANSLSDSRVVYPVLVDNPEPSDEDWPDELRDLTRQKRDEWDRAAAERKAQWQAEHPLVQTANGLRRQP